MALNGLAICTVCSIVPLPSYVRTFVCSLQFVAVRLQKTSNGILIARYTLLRILKRRASLRFFARSLVCYLLQIDNYVSRSVVKSPRKLTFLATVSRKNERGTFNHVSHSSCDPCQPTSRFVSLTKPLARERFTFH